MMRDYTDMMHMEPRELAQHALDCAKVGIVSIVLVEALAVQLDTQSAIANELEQLKSELADAERRAESWREEAQAVQRQLDRGRG